MKPWQRSINRLFNIKPDEWLQTSLLFLVTTLSNVGFTWGLMTAYAAFLQDQEGAGLVSLPWILILISILSVIFISIYTLFVDQIADDILHNVIFGIEAIGIIFGLILLYLNYTSLAYPFLYLWGVSLIAVTDSHQTTYINSFFNTQEAKRLMPTIEAGYRFGGIIAGLTMPLLNNLFGNAEALIIIWLLIHLMMMGLVWFIPKILNKNNATPHKPLAISSSTPTTPPHSLTANAREGFNYTIQSPYLRSVAMSTLLLAILMAILEYKSTEFLVKAYPSATELADFLAILVVLGNIFTIPMLLFGLGRLITRLGLGNVSLIFPMGNLAACLSLMIWPSWGTSSIAYFVRNDFRLALQSSIDGLLYNAISLKVKGRVRAFVSGLVGPIGSLIGGGLLLLFIFSHYEWLMLPILGMLSLAYVGSMTIVRQLYGQAIVKMLELEDYSLLMTHNTSQFNTIDFTVLKSLETKLVESNDPQFTLFMASLISQIGGNGAITILIQAVKSAHDPETRAGLIELMIAAEMSGQEVTALYTDLLTDPQGKVREAALAGLNQLSNITDYALQNSAIGMLNDPEIEVRTQALLILAETDDFFTTPAIIAALNQILSQPDSAERARGVSVLGQAVYLRTAHNLSNVTKPTYRLTTFLLDKDDQVRLQTALAIEQIATNKLAENLIELILQQVSAITNDPVERIRQAALIIFSRLNKREAIPILIAALMDISPEVRSTAVEEMVRMGKIIIPSIHGKLDSPQPDVRKMAAIVLSRINKQEFGSLIAASITHNLLHIYRNISYIQALSGQLNTMSIIVLNDTLKEENQQRLDEIFYLLTAVNPAETIKLVADALKNRDVRVQANALEALETLTTPQTARLIGSLAAPNNPLENLLQLSEEMWGMDCPTFSQLVKDLALNDHHNGWLRAIIIFALGEMGSIDYNQVVDAPPKSARKPRRAMPNLLDALDSPHPSPLPGGEGTAGLPSPSERITELPSPKERITELPSPSERITELPSPSERITELPSPSGRITELPSPSERITELPSPSGRGAGGEGAFKSKAEIEAILDKAINDNNAEVRLAAESAKRFMARQNKPAKFAITGDTFMLSAIEKIIFLKKVPFFQGMTIDQLKTLSTVCEETLFPEDTRIFNEGDMGGTLYVVVNGKVAIEQAGQRKGSFARLATLESHAYFGETNLFDNSPHTTSAITIQDTLTLQLRREPLIILARRYPDMSLELIKVLSQRLREANAQVAGLTRTKPRELHKLFDQFD